MDRIVITLNSESVHPNRFWGSMLHGILNDLLPAPYPEQLHDEQLKPLSQWVEVSTGNTFKWHIQTITDDLANAILEHICSQKVLHCKHMGIDWQVLSFEHEHTTMQDFMKKIYLAPEPAKGVAITLMTTCTHKVDGRYAIFPTVELMGANIRHRFCMLAPDSPLCDDEVLQQILQHVYISRYSLESSTYSLEGHYTTGYFGRLELHFDGPDPLRRLAETLFMFANWTGIGIKTALGMGGCKVVRLEQKSMNK